MKTIYFTIAVMFTALTAAAVNTTTPDAPKTTAETSTTATKPASGNVVYLWKAGVSHGAFYHVNGDCARRHTEALTTDGAKIYVTTAKGAASLDMIPCLECAGHDHRTAKSKK